MGRKIRIDGNGWIHHAMARGNNRGIIFRDDEDRIQYLQWLDHYSRLFKIKVLAFCLMDNHVHHLLQSLQGNLSEFFQSFHGRFSRWVNWKYDRIGHVFQSRFKNKIVLSNRYLHEVGRYIHMNPVRAGLVKWPQFYEWSSLRSFLGIDSYSFVERNVLLAPFRGPNFRKNLLRFTVARDQAAEGKRNWPENDDWYAELPPLSNPELKDLAGTNRIVIPTAIEIVDQVSKSFIVSPGDIVRGWRDPQVGFARGAAVLMLQRFRGAQWREIAGLMGFKSRFGVSQAASRLKKVALQNQIIRDRLVDLGLESLSN